MMNLVVTATMIPAVIDTVVDLTVESTKDMNGGARITDQGRGIETLRLRAKLLGQFRAALQAHRRFTPRNRFESGIGGMASKPPECSKAR
jgi:hypothetical protein